MPSAKINLLANYLGRVCSGAITFLLVPIYIRLMGIEAYGVVGLYLSFLAIFALLDLGLSAVVTRELAAVEQRQAPSQRASDLVYTLQFVYWAVTGAIAAGLALSASWLAENWLTAVSLPVSEVRSALVFMGFTIAGHMLFGFYSAGLLGLQRHVAANLINVGFVVVRNVGALLALCLVRPSITVFFAWQAFSVFIGVAVASTAMRRYLPTGTPTLRPRLLQDLWLFAAGTTTASFSFVLVHQTDKALLSRMLSLQEFGYYAFAGVTAGIMQYLSSPIFATFFSAFSRKVALGQHPELVLQYHRASQVMAVVLVPAGAMLVCFSEPLLHLWTGDAELADQVVSLTALLGLGMTLHTLTTLAYSAQLAYGWTSLTVSANAILSLVLASSILQLVPRFGAIAAAAVWASLNAVHLIGSVWVMHRRIMKGEMRSWFVKDVLPPIAAVLAVSLLVRLAAPETNTRLGGLVWLTCVYLAMLLAAAFVAPVTRGLILELIRRVRS